MPTFNPKSTPSPTWPGRLWPTIAPREPRRPEAWQCRIGPIPTPSRSPANRSGDAPGADKAAPLRCASCHNVITSHDQAIEVNGCHEHAFFNPVGIAYAIRCFCQAHGVRVQGQPTSAFSWFIDHAWQIAHCTACGCHLGWRFTGPSTFYGLIGAHLK